MKSPLAGVIGVIVTGSCAVMSCSSSTDDSSSGSPGVFGSTDAGSTAGVDCTHPGAGKSIGGDRCECSTTHNAIAGDWSAKRSCRENTSCVIKDQDETIKVTQNGTTVSLSVGGSSFSGTICGDFVVYDGAKGSGRECGQLRLTDDTHWFLDSCYVASGECARSFGQGCPSEKGQCTGTATKGGAAAALVKDICK